VRFKTLPYSTPCIKEPSVKACQPRRVPVFGRLDKAELRGSESPYQEQDDGWEATSILAGIQGGGFSRICG